MRPKTVIYITFGIMTVIGMISIYVVSDTLSRINDQIFNASQFHSKSLVTIQKLDLEMQSAIQESFAYIISGDLDEKADFMRWSTNLPTEEDAYIKIADIHDPNETREHIIFNNISLLHRELIDKALAMFDEYEKTGAVSIETYEDYEKIIDKTSELYNRLLSFEILEVNEINRNSVDLMKMTYQNTVLIGILLMLAIITIVFYFSIYISYQKQLDKEAREANQLTHI